MTDEERDDDDPEVQTERRMAMERLACPWLAKPGPGAKPHVVAFAVPHSVAHSWLMGYPSPVAVTEEDGHEYPYHGSAGRYDRSVDLISDELHLTNSGGIVEVNIGAGGTWHKLDLSKSRRVR